MALLSGDVLGGSARRHAEGNYDERAFLASLVGPMRRPWGSTRVVNFSGNAGQRLQQQLVSNKSAQVLFVSVHLDPAAAVVGVTFGKSSSPSPSSDVSHDFSVEPFFEAVLLPDDELYATVDAATKLAVTQVAF